MTSRVGQTAADDCKIASVRVEPLGVVLSVREGETLMQAAWRQSYYWPTICHGQVSCTVCATKIISGMENLGQPERNEHVVMELQFAQRAARLEGRLRLACCVRPTGDAIVLKRGVRYNGSHPTRDQKTGT